MTLWKGGGAREEREDGGRGLRKWDEATGWINSQLMFFCCTKLFRRSRPWWIRRHREEMTQNTDYVKNCEGDKKGRNKIRHRQNLSSERWGCGSFSVLLRIIHNREAAPRFDSIYQSIESLVETVHADPHPAVGQKITERCSLLFGKSLSISLPPPTIPPAWLKTYTNNNNIQNRSCMVQVSAAGPSAVGLWLVSNVIPCHGAWFS